MLHCCVCLVGDIGLEVGVGLKCSAGRARQTRADNGTIGKLGEELMKQTEHLILGCHPFHLDWLPGLGG